MFDSLPRWLSVSLAVGHLFERVSRFVAGPFQCLLDADRVAVFRTLVAVLAVSVFDSAVESRLPFSGRIYVWSVITFSDAFQRRCGNG